MSHARYIFHPVLAHKRSRLIFIGYLVISIFVGGVLWWRMHQILQYADVRHLLIAPSNSGVLNFFLSPHFKYTLILASALLAATLTAHYVVGPLKRIERWVMDWETGQPVRELTVRSEDKFWTLVRLINQLKEKINPPRKLQ